MAETCRLTVYEIAPLRRTDVVLAARTRGLDPERFLGKALDRGVQAFALKPVTLGFLLDTFEQDGDLGNSSVDLYSDGLLRKCEELNPYRRNLQAEPFLTPGQRLRLAKRIAALTILTDRPAIWIGDISQKSATDLTVDEIIGSSDAEGSSAALVTGSAIRETLGTALFVSRGQDRLGFEQNTFAEFLAAQNIERHEGVTDSGQESSISPN